MSEHRGKKLGKYILIKEIGKGQFGTVYVAQSEEDGKQYAVKCVQKSVTHNPTNNDIVNRFEHNAQKTTKNGGRCNE
jgi:serine/threonine protein kinase